MEDDDELFDEFIMADAKKSLAVHRQIEELREDYTLQMELDDCPDF